MHTCMLSRFSRVWLCATQGTAALQAPLSTGFSRQEHRNGLSFPSLDTWSGRTLRLLTRVPTCGFFMWLLFLIAWKPLGGNFLHGAADCKDNYSSKHGGKYIVFYDLTLEVISHHFHYICWSWENRKLVQTPLLDDRSIRLHIRGTCGVGEIVIVTFGKHIPIQWPHPQATIPIAHAKGIISFPRCTKSYPITPSVV